ncbi:unnamed protein product [Miscanthus lutarioriparius]|uniref:Uncharacterized protein n=1 Tax=Miscanthus lutarioriparius TaxID=422564 RepID=A0A811QCZ2_9POAL|nr:unnamed protein product [Miscanthus lutarioriparius]
MCRLDNGSQKHKLRIQKFLPPRLGLIRVILMRQRTREGFLWGEAVRARPRRGLCFHFAVTGEGERGDGASHRLRGRQELEVVPLKGAMTNEVYQVWWATGGAKAGGAACQR